MKEPLESDPPNAYDHYRDPAYYDHAYARYHPDRAHYVALAQELGGPVLELGVGTGRIAAALAEAGVEVIGVDRTRAMLDRCRARLASRPRRVRERITLIEADMRELALDRRFPLVIAPFNVFQHLYTRRDFERALAVCRAHLWAEGRLSLDVLVPDPGSLARDPARFYKCRPITHPRDRRRYAYAEAFHYDHDRQIQVTRMRFTDLEDSSSRHFDDLTQRQIFPRELEALLHYNGFEVLRHDGGFAGEPLDERAESQVVVARPRGPREDRP